MSLSAHQWYHWYTIIVFVVSELDMIFICFSYSICNFVVCFTSFILYVSIVFSHFYLLVLAVLVVVLLDYS